MKKPLRRKIGEGAFFLLPQLPSALNGSKSPGLKALQFQAVFRGLKPPASTDTGNCGRSFRLALNSQSATNCPASVFSMGARVKGSRAISLKAE
jgi:hypothetical protein